MEETGDEAAFELRLRVYVCGQLAVEYGPTILREAAFPARQGRRLWTYLVLHRQQPVGRDDLAEAVWGDAIPDAWDVALNVLISRLRRLLGALDCERLALRGETGRYALVLPSETFIDYERARAALHRAEVLLRSTEYGEALAEAGVATAIASRGFLPGEGGPWVVGTRWLLAETRLLALEYAVEAELGRGRADAAEREAEQLLALDPLREAGYRLLMRALAAGGKVSQVNRAMETCRRVLQAEMELAPSPDTERLYQTLIDG